MGWARGERNALSAEWEGPSERVVLVVEAAVVVAVAAAAAVEERGGAVGWRGAVNAAADAAAGGGWSGVVASDREAGAGICAAAGWAVVERDGVMVDGAMAGAMLVTGGAKSSKVYQVSTMTCAWLITSHVAR